MKTSFTCFLSGAAVLAALPLSASNWPGWRGPEGTGVSAEKNLPLKWSTNENVRWRVDLPGRGNSSPIVWGALDVHPVQGKGKPPASGRESRP
jgi:hypothetical protein